MTSAATTTARPISSQAGTCRSASGGGRPPVVGRASRRFRPPSARPARAGRPRPARHVGGRCGPWSLGVGLRLASSPAASSASYAARLLRVEQHLRGLVVGPEPAVGRVEVGDRGLPGGADLRVGGVAVDVEQVVEARAVHCSSSPVIGVKSSTSHSPPVLTRSTSIRNGTGSCRHALAALALGEGVGERARHQRGRGVLVHHRDAGGEDLGLARRRRPAPRAARRRPPACRRRSRTWA